MKFQFCGNVSCPQWFIAQIAVLTKITAVKMKLIFNQLVTLYLQGSDISAKVTKLLNGTGLDIYEMNAVVSTLNFILFNAVKFHVSDSVLNKQLIDLGLPKENVESITKTFKTNRQKLLQKSVQKMLKISSNIELEYSIHEFLGSQRLKTQTMTPIRFAQVNLQYSDLNDGNVNKSMIVCEEQLDELIYQLQDALSIVQKLQTNK